ncbi:uncharacterized protein LOC123366702 [Mauremys mutica]|uniref:uncharacterized protein LOC123366702 n=1 Tax=Mauremys mutica TaxID=74926 RepID=UPI001D160562|nr:uncharacterized protein LOC123366702 [Mauremys mutica]
MSRLLRMFRKKALQVVPEPEGGSCHLPQEQSGPSVPAGGEEAPSRARRWKCPAFWQRKPAPGAGAEVGEAPARPKWSWPRMRLGRQDSAQKGSRAGWLWGLLCGTQRPQEPSPNSQQEASPCPVTEDLPASPGQEVEDPCPSTSSSACSPGDSGSAWDSGSSKADGRRCFVPGTPRDSEDEEEKWMDMATEEAALKNILEQLQGREKDEAQQLMFLHTIHPACLAAQQRGQETLELHCCKVAVMERIVVSETRRPAAGGRTETWEGQGSPRANGWGMAEVETHLRAALHAVFTLSTQKDTTQEVQDQHRVLPDLLDAMLGNLLAESLGTDRLHYILEDLHRVLPDLLDAMLGNLLAESPGTDRLHYILEHINYWIVSRVSQERAKAIRISTALLRFTISLPELDDLHRVLPDLLDAMLGNLLAESPDADRLHYILESEQSLSGLIQREELKP